MQKLDTAVKTQSKQLYIDDSISSNSTIDTPIKDIELFDMEQGQSK